MTLCIAEAQRALSRHVFCFCHADFQWSFLISIKIGTGMGLVSYYLLMCFISYLIIIYSIEIGINMGNMRTAFTHLCMSLGPCPTARQTNFLLQCDEDGNYRSLQCRKKVDSNTYLCQCVVPSTGVVLHGTQVELEDLADAPDCDDMGKIGAYKVLNKRAAFAEIASKLILGLKE